MDRAPALLLRLSLLVCMASSCQRADGCVPGAARAREISAAEKHLREGNAVQAAQAYKRLIAERPEPALERGLGLAYTALRQFARAEPLLQASVKRQSKDAEARVALVATLVGQRKLSAARSQARALVQSAPQLLTAQLFAAALAQGEPSIREALARLSAYEHRRGTNTTRATPCELLHARATLQSALGDADGARQTLERAAHAELADPDDAVWVAEAHLHAGRPLQAEWLLARVTALARTRSTAARLLAEVALDLEHHELAAEALSKLKGEPELPMDGLLRARTELGLGQADAAITRLQSLLPRLQRERLTAMAEQASLTLGRALTSAGRFDEARKAFGAASSLPGKIALAELELRRHEHDAAIAVLKEVLARTPHQATASILLGNAYEAKGQPETALSIYRAYAQQNDLDPRAHYFVGRALEAAGNATDAGAAYARSVELAPGSIAPLTRLLILQEKSGDRAGAEERIRSQISAVPRSGAVRRLLGELYERRGELAAAENAYKAGIEMDPEDAIAWLALGEFYRRTGREVRSLEAVQQVLQRTPDHAEALALAAQIENKLGRTQNAIDHYQKALLRRPRDLAIQNNLALLLAETGRELDQALALAQQAKRLAPDSPLVADTLGFVHLRRGELTAALPLLEEAARKLPEQAEVLLHLGLAQLASGRRAAGQVSLERALELDPDMPGAAEARRALGNAAQ
jgi:tetratricopeptide (TPR) repeat protein